MHWLAELLIQDLSYIWEEREKRPQWGENYDIVLERNAVL